jgi:glutathione S-transferase
MEVKLFGSRLSPFVEKVARALQMKGLRFELVPPKSPLDFKKWNPTTGKMPVLEIDGVRHYDSSRILRKLDEVAPEPPLFSSDPAVAARQRFLEDWSDEALYWYVMGLRWNPANAPATTAQIVETLPVFIRPIANFLVPRQIGAQARAQGLQRLPMAILLEEMGLRLDELIVLLGDEPYFFAPRVSGADLALFGQFSTIASGPTPQGERLLRARPKLVQWHARVEAATAAGKGVARERTAA